MYPRAPLLVCLVLAGCSAGAPIDREAPASPSTPMPMPPGAMELAIPSCPELSALWVDRYHDALKASWRKDALDCAHPTAPSLDRGFAEAAFVLEQTRFDLVGLPADREPPPAALLDFVTSKYHQLVVDAERQYPATDVDNGVLHFYPGIAEETGYQVVGNLIHEARHADGLQYLHVECLAGPNQGAGMCDDGVSERFTEGGPHAIAILYFAWVAARGNWPVVQKKDLRSLSTWLLDERINATAQQRADWAARWLSDW